MVTIRITKAVKAPMDRCFRLARSIDLQRVSRGAAAVPTEGRVSGLIGPGETVTWQSGSSLKTRINAYRPPSYYCELVEGADLSYEHEHHFAPFNDGTRIREEIRLTPKGLFGRIAMRLYLRKRLVRQVEQHIAMLKQVAESEEWHTYLDGQPDFDLRPQAVTTTASQNPSSGQTMRQQVG